MIRSAAAACSVLLLALPAAAQSPKVTVSPDPAAAIAGGYRLDKNHASVIAKLSHLGLSQYTFRFNGLDGELQYDPRNLARSKVVFTVDPASIDTGNEKFNTELGGARFLNARPNTPARFESTSLTPTGPRTGRVTGNFTLNGVTHPETFTVTFNGGGTNFGRHQLGFSAEGAIRRSRYNIAPGMPAALLGDEVRLLIEAEFVRPAG